jgi:uncharacterized protein YndB with AHSA1/START domain
LALDPGSHHPLNHHRYAANHHHADYSTNHAANQRPQEAPMTAIAQTVLPADAFAAPAEPAPAWSLQQPIAAPRASVWRAFTTATRLAEWLCYDAQIEAAVGGRLYLYWREQQFYAMGEFLALVSDSRLVFSWSDKNQPAFIEMTVELSEDADGLTIVSVSSDSAPSLLAQERWQRGLAVLQSTQETGYHLDYLERPMMGMLIAGNVTAENASEYGVPISSGVALSGTLPGLSAAAAGLQARDVLVELDGQLVQDVQAIGAILRPHQAGDVLAALFYRGSVGQQVAMELKPRPRYPVPASLDALASQLSAHLAAETEALAAVFAGVSEDEARHKETPKRWSALEVVAHLVANERDHLLFITSLVEGNELEVFTASMDARVAALAAGFDSIAAALAAWQEAHAQTGRLVRLLPAEFLGQRAHIVRLQQAREFDAPHTRQHLEQIKRAIAAARA